MKKFKVKIISADGGRWYKNGEEHEVTDIGDGFYLVSAGGTIKKCHCELAWQPEPEEMIEAADCKDFSDATNEKFWGMFEGFFMCYGEGSAFHDIIPVPFGFARPIKKTHTITLEDGTKVELSEESYQSLKDGINN